MPAPTVTAGCGAGTRWTTTTATLKCMGDSMCFKRCSNRHARCVHARTGFGVGLLYSEMVAVRTAWVDTVLTGGFCAQSDGVLGQLYDSIVSKTLFGPAMHDTVWTSYA